MRKGIGACGYLLVTLLASLSAAAQTVQVIPSNPTTLDNIILRVDNTTYFSGIATRTGNHIRVDMSVCPILCGFPVDVPIGMLPAGLYTYEMFDGNTVIASGSFAVSGAAIPTLSPIALAMLSVLLAGAGWFFIARRT